MASTEGSDKGDRSDREPGAVEKAQVEYWEKWLESQNRDVEERKKKYTRYRNLVAGNPSDEDGNKDVYVNILAGQFDAMMPYLYSRNPDIQIRPSKAVAASDYDQWKKFGQTAEIVVDRELYRANGRVDQLKHIMKREARAGLTNGIGWFKAFYQVDVQHDPLAATRIDDAQDNIQIIESLIEKMHEAQGPDDRSLIVGELRDQVTSLADREQIRVARGVVLSHVPADDIVVDGGLLELVDYVDAPAIAHRIWMTEDDLRAKLGLDDDDMKGVKLYIARGDEMVESNGDGKEKRWAAVWEIWCKRARMVYTVVEGLKRWARPPFSPYPASTRFYPFFALAWHWVDGVRDPTSDTGNWENLQHEYTRTRAAFAEHRRRSVPATVINGQALTSETDIGKLTNHVIQEHIVLESLPAEIPVGNAVARLVYPAVDPGLYTTEPIRQDLELLSGLQDANRSVAVQPKTATEAGIMQSGMLGRMGGRLDVVEDVLADLAHYTFEQCVQVLTLQQAEQIAGSGAVWFEHLDLEDITEKLRVSIVPGTTGQKNSAQEQQAWGTLFPMITKTIIQVVELRAQGQNDAADAIIAVMKETLRRADVRIDLDDFMPKPKQVAEGLPGPAPGQMGADAGAAGGQPADAGGYGPGQPGVQEPGQTMIPGGVNG